MASRTGAVDVVLEVGAKRVFARAVDWPGWCRSGRTEEAAVEALAAVRDRYAPVAAAAGLRAPADATVGDRPGTRHAATRPPTSAPPVRWHDRTSVRSVRRTRAGSPPSWTRAGTRWTRSRPRLRPSCARGRAVVAATATRCSPTWRQPRRRTPAGSGCGCASRPRATGRPGWPTAAVLLELLGRPSDGERLVEPKGWPQRYAAPGSPGTSSTTRGRCRTARPPERAVGPRSGSGGGRTRRQRAAGRAGRAATGAQPA